MLKTWTCWPIMAIIVVILLLGQLGLVASMRSLRIRPEAFAIEMERDFSFTGMWTRELDHAEHLNDPLENLFREAQALVNLGRIQEAKEIMRKIRDEFGASSQTNSEALFLGMALERRGFLDEADEWLEWIEEDPNTLDVHAFHAWALLRTDRKLDRALELAEHVYQPGSNIADHALMIVALQKNGRAQEAEALQNETLSRFKEEELQQILNGSNQPFE